jgi:hypothetical protein
MKLLLICEVCGKEESQEVSDDTLPQDGDILIHKDGKKLILIGRLFTCKTCNSMILD